MQRKLRPFSMLSLSQEGGAYLRLQNRTVKPQDLAHKRLHPSLTFRSSPRLISIGQLHTLPCFHLRPIYDIVYVEPYSFRMRDLILGGVSRLDAFSVYLVRTWLPSYALGRTTGAPEVRPSRSSRTKDSSLQISYARNR